MNIMKHLFDASFFDSNRKGEQNKKQKEYFNPCSVYESPI